MKKRKLSFSGLLGLGIDFCDSYDNIISGVHGVTFVMYHNLNSVQRDELNNYNNIRIGRRTWLQAPEIKQDIIFLGNKCF